MSLLLKFVLFGELLNRVTSWNNPRENEKYSNFYLNEMTRREAMRKYVIENDKKSIFHKYSVSLKIFNKNELRIILF